MREISRLDRYSTQQPDGLSESQQLALSSVVASERISINGTVNGSETLSLPGNRQPRDMMLTISSGAETTSENVSASVDRETTTLPIAVDSEGDTNITAQIDPTTNTTSTSTSGTLTVGEANQTVEVRGESPTPELTGQETTGDPITYRDTTANGTKTIDVEGTQSAEATVTVTGQTIVGNQQRATYTTNGTLDPIGNYEPAGVTDADEPKITVAGQSTTSADTRYLTGLESGALPTFDTETSSPSSSQRVTSANVTFVGNTTVSSGQASFTRQQDGDTVSVPLGGNQPTDVTLTLRAPTGGDVDWETDYTGESSNIVVVDDVAFVSNGNGRLMRIDTETGDVLSDEKRDNTYEALGATDEKAAFVNGDEVRIYNKSGELYDTISDISNYDPTMHRFTNGKVVILFITGVI